MEQNFQTSFIPKKPMVEERALSPRSVSLLMVIASFILFTVFLATGGLFFYRAIAQKNSDNMANQLNQAKNRFEPSLITDLQVLDKRLRASTEILDKHIAITPIFLTLEKLTMKTVRYTQFGYAVDSERGKKILVKMSGQAIGYRSVALQSDLFAQNPNLIDPVFSNLTLDEKGNVLFDLEFLVEPSFVDYKQMLLADNPI